MTYDPEAYARQYREITRQGDELMRAIEANEARRKARQPEPPPPPKAPSPFGYHYGDGFETLWIENAVSTSPISKNRPLAPTTQIPNSPGDALARAGM